ncbi:glycosyltransferase family 4 protein [candidate division WOR-3 bacterium]|nr:glycosyltransferase family 4 protein [candidate division WOR-3 bacterium]
MSNRLKICLVSAAFHPYPSGVTEHVHHLALELHRTGHDVEVLTTRFKRHSDDSRLPFPVTRFGRAVLVPMNRSFATLPVGLGLSGRVRRFLSEREFDIVHCHGLFWPEISYWALRWSRSVNLITFLTGGFRLHTAGSGIYRRLFRGQLSRIHGRIAISNRARQAAEPYVPGDFRIIPCGVDLKRFRPGLEPMPGTGGPRLLFVGRLDGRKGILVLLRALPEVLVRFPGARLDVVGTGPEEKRARALCRDLGIESAVRFCGRPTRDDLPRWYAGAGVYCSPALGGETLGIVLLEAMASGVPVVASRIPGYDETVRTGVEGILVPPGEPTPLADALVRVLTDTDLGGRLRRAGLERAREYAWPDICRRTLGFYSELLATR